MKRESDLLLPALPGALPVFSGKAPGLGSLLLSPELAGATADTASACHVRDAL